MHHFHRLIKFPLDLHNAIGLARVLVLDDIFLQLGQRAGVLAQGRVGESSARVLSQELIDYLAQEPVRHQFRIFCISDYHAGNALFSTICMETVCRLFRVVDGLALSWHRALGDRAGEEREELANAVQDMLLMPWFGGGDRQNGRERTSDG